MIGPFRGGRTVAISGVPGSPNVFYMAPNNGGVWKTTDFGQTWNAIFDDEPTGSIGAVAIAQSLAAAAFMLGGVAAKRRLEETEARLAATLQYVTEKG